MEPFEFDCCECGRHIVDVSGLRRDPSLCAECIHIPGWFNNPQLAQLLDPGNHRKPPPARELLKSPPMSDSSELTEEQAIVQVRTRFPQSVAEHDQYGWFVRAIDADGGLYGFLGRKSTRPEAWIEAAKLLQMLI